MPPITTSTEVDRPAEDVFAYATDPTRFHEWQNGVVDGPHGPAAASPAVGATRASPPGASAAPTGRAPPRSFTSTHPRTWGVRGIDGPIRATVDLTVEPLTARDPA